MPINFKPSSGRGATIFDNDYLDQHREELIAKLYLESETIGWAHFIPNVKNRMSLNGLDEVGDVQDASCDFEHTGDVTLSQRELIVAAKEIKDKICPKDLEKTYLGAYMKSNKEIPFIGVFAEKYINKGQNFIDRFIWLGDSTGGASGVWDAKYGIIYEAGINVGVGNDKTINGYDSSLTDIKDMVDYMVSKAPAEVLERKDAILVMSYTDFIAYQQKLVAANLVHYNATMNQQDGTYLYIPGTNIKVKPTIGINSANIPNSGTSKIDGKPMILTYEDNIVVGADMIDDDTTFDIWYSRDNDQVRANLQFKIGGTYRYPDRVVIGYKLIHP